MKQWDRTGTSQASSVEDPDLHSFGSPASESVL